ncbi:MAG: efflux RND transporter periplasmic adaptor subunit [Puniceicoccaceae bacterium]
MKATIFLPLLAAALVLGLLIGRLSSPRHDDESTSATNITSAPSEYTCSMHPQIRQPTAGKCPICAMDLIPAGQTGSDDSGPREISLSPHAKSLARVATAAVERRIPEAEIRLFGRVEIDESRLRSITARFPGRLEQLYVNYTGVRVNQGDHLGQIYSPELLTAQAELLSARRFNDARAQRSASEKLALWGLSESAIRAIESRGEPADKMDIEATLSGFVVEKMVNEGDYIETGSIMFRIADLSTVWVILDAYEMDKPWLRFGQTVTFTAEALPGQSIEGRISFIPPVLDPATRTFKVRVNVANEDLRLRPGMFVTGIVAARVAADGIAFDPSLEGKWISPMHPEIVKDSPGSCDVCGMDLVAAADLGYTAAGDSDTPLLVPASAVLQTGRRAIVYVELPDRELPTYEGREIVLGPRAGGHYLVRSGLEEGERVVVNGAFKIDSALQLLAKPSMMSAPDPNAPPVIEASPEMSAALGKLLEAYFPVWRGLAADDFEAAKLAASELEAATHQFHGQPGNLQASEFFESTLAKLGKTATAVSKSKDIEAARVEFEHLSHALITAVQAIGLPDGVRVERAYCPMTFEGRRSDWLQDDKALLNPYFGAAMLRCGDFDRLDSPAPASSAPGHSSGGHNH